jgi:SnoaL-like domain
VGERASHEVPAPGGRQPVCHDEAGRLARSASPRRLQAVRDAAGLRRLGHGPLPEDCVFYEPRGVHRGRDEIDQIAGAIWATHPDFQYTPAAQPEELHNAGRIRWVSGRPGEAPAYAGTDFIIVRDGRIAALYHFFDALVA